MPTPSLAPYPDVIFPESFYTARGSSKDEISPTPGFESISSEVSSVDDTASGYGLSTATAKKSGSLRIGSSSILDSEEFTINKLRFGSELFGREEDEARLKTLFRRSIEDASKELVLISGGAGSGKSVLAQKVKDFVRQEGGFFVAGKFEMQQSDEPYSAIGGAFHALCDDLLFYKEQQTEQSYSRWNFTYQDFVSKLASSFSEDDGGILRPVFPSVVGFMGGSADGTSDSEKDQATESTRSFYLESKQAFHFAFIRLLGVLASFGPVALVLDDLHWADQASMELVESVLADDLTPGIMVIGTYRDNEVDDQHILVGTVNRIKSLDIPRATIVDLRLSDLTDKDISDLLQHTISISAEEAGPLSSCVHRKTAGNALFVKKYLVSLYDDGLLRFDFGRMKWRFDVDRIMSKSSATENVVAFLTEKLRELPRLLKLILPRVASLGHRFNLTTFEIVVGHFCSEEDITVAIQEYSAMVHKRGGGATENELVSGENVDGRASGVPGSKERKRVEQQPWQRKLLSVCESEGLLSKTMRGWSWEHDKVREAAFNLVEENELSVIQIEIGELLFKKLSPDELSKELFVVTALLNPGAGSRSKDDPLRLEIAQLNLMSGKVAFSTAAFESAADHLTMGIGLLPTDHWERHYALSLDLYSSAAESQYCVGNHKKTKEYCDIVIGLEKTSLLEKRRAYDALIQSNGAQGRTVSAKELAQDVLAKLGCRFPRRFRLIHTLVQLVPVLASVDKTTERICRLKRSDDAEQQWVIYLLDRLSTFAYQSDPTLLPLALLKCLDRTLMYGITEMTGPMLAVVGLLVSSTGNFSGGRKYANLALQYMTRNMEARTKFLAYNFVLHLQIPFENCKKPILEAYESGLKSGDLETAFWCVQAFLEIQLYTGSNLSRLMEDSKMYCRQMIWHQQEKIAWSTKIVWQIAANLSSRTSKRHVLQGEAMDEIELAKVVVGADQFLEKIQLYRLKAIAAFWYNEHEVVVRLMEDLDIQNFSFDKQIPGATGVGIAYFQCALSCISMARKSKDRKHKRRAKRFLVKIKTWVRNGNANFQHRESLMEAEWLSLGKNQLAAQKHYEVAILLAGRWGVTHDHALAHERYADYFVRNGDQGNARYHYLRAIELYTEWGGVGKVDIIQENARELLVPVPEIAVLEVDSSALSVEASGNIGF